MNTKTNVNVKSVTADPSCLGLFGLAMVTLVASTEKLGWTTGLGFVLPWAIFLGAVAQLIACVIDFKKNNLFGATAFGAYGLFWIAMSFAWCVKLGVLGETLAASADGAQLGVAFIGYLLFSLFMTIAACETNKALLTIIALINVLFITLALASFGIAASVNKTIAGWVELAISLAGFYAAAGAMLNNHLGRIAVPMGAPLGRFKKPPAALSRAA